MKKDIATIADAIGYAFTIAEFSKNDLDTNCFKQLNELFEAGNAGDPIAKDVLTEHAKTVDTDLVLAYLAMAVKECTPASHRIRMN